MCKVRGIVFPRDTLLYSTIHRLHARVYQQISPRVPFPMSDKDNDCRFVRTSRFGRNAGHADFSHPSPLAIRAHACAANPEVVLSEERTAIFIYPSYNYFSFSFLLPYGDTSESNARFRKSSSRNTRSRCTYFILNKIIIIISDYIL